MVPLQVVIIAFVLALAPGYGAVNTVETVAEWLQLEFGFPTTQDQESAKAAGNLVPENGTPIDVQPQYLSNGTLRLFTTIPRFVTGVPYTLATVSSTNGTNGPVLQPYPSYDWHNDNGDDCDKITSITECNQMWIVDTGSIGTTTYCPPQLLQFDLNTDTLLHRYRFLNSTYTPSASLFITPNVLVKDPAPAGTCNNTMVYVADVTFHGLMVYDHEAQTSWRVENRFMYPAPDHGKHIIANETFYLMDGLFALTNDKTNLYFHPMATASEYAVPLSALNNQDNWANNPEALPEQFTLLGSRSSECAASAIDSLNNIYCVTFNPIQLISWNTNTTYTPENFVVLPAEADELEFVSGMKVVKNPEGQEELWLISNRFQKIADGTLDFSEINFRILRRNLADLQ
ncbi:protein yellow-like [Drosophila subpulchrella]|uniref:protein yellow-like n=1 Tax=Drosophila subpulchrella TaxID=1486046 RepID=UPI0018A127EB|nr:protein yellow-like [Drosophila subpulchrella]